MDRLGVSCVDFLDVVAYLAADVLEVRLLRHEQVVRQAGVIRVFSNPLSPLPVVLVAERAPVLDQVLVRHAAAQELLQGVVLLLVLRLPLYQRLSGERGVYHAKI